MNPPPFKVWLEAPGREPIPIGEGCSLGRSKMNQVMLKDQTASRRHAIIHPQGQAQYWLVDFGSMNGTLINGRRVIQPTLLHDGDQIFIGDECFVFRKQVNQPDPERRDTTETAVTEPNVVNVQCWLLVADIVGSTQLSLSCSPEELPVVVGRWFSSCKEIIDSCGGQINKFLGDGFFAYWVDVADVADKINAALQRLQEQQREAQPAFRWVLHFGPVTVGGAGTMGEDSILGRDVIFAFRMETLAGKLKLPAIVSVPARDKLPIADTLRRIGPYDLKGFDGDFTFFAL